MKETVLRGGNRMVARRAARWLCEQRRVPRCNSCSASAVGVLFCAPLVYSRSSFQPPLPLRFPLSCPPPLPPRQASSAARHDKRAAATAHKLTFGSNFSWSSPLRRPISPRATNPAVMACGLRIAAREARARAAALLLQPAAHARPASRNRKAFEISDPLPRSGSAAISG